MGESVFAELRIPGRGCWGGGSVCRFKDSGKGRWGGQRLQIQGFPAGDVGGGSFADLGIPGRGCGTVSVCRFKDCGKGRWGGSLQI